MATRVRLKRHSAIIIIFSIPSLRVFFFFFFSFYLFCVSRTSGSDSFSLPTHTHHLSLLPSSFCFHETHRQSRFNHVYRRTPVSYFPFSLCLFLLFIKSVAIWIYSTIDWYSAIYWPYFRRILVFTHNDECDGVLSMTMTVTMTATVTLMVSMITVWQWRWSCRWRPCRMP